MIFTVSSAAAPLRSTQNTCAPARAKVTAVALPLPQPGPIEPAPTTIAVLPLSRSTDFSRYDIVEVIVARMKPLRNPGIVPRIWLALHPGYGLHLLILMMSMPIGRPKISDSVRQFPSAHSRHSPAAPELPSTTSGIGGRAGAH